MTLYTAWSLGLIGASGTGLKQQHHAIGNPGHNPCHCGVVEHRECAVAPAACFPDNGCDGGYARAVE